MPTFRIYFRKGSAIVGREDFEAAGLDAATLIADMLFQACLDKCEAYELWQGERMLGNNLAWAGVITAELRERNQAIVIECEEAIRDSKWAIASSQRLLELLGEIKKGGA